MQSFSQSKQRHYPIKLRVLCASAVKKLREALCLLCEEIMLSGRVNSSTFWRRSMLALCETLCSNL
ncbi:MAG: hypothetical protein LW842_05400, partial [Sphingobacteriales bacterium]|nr:hypothetical protein [Sphingobacteriales bacterium]